MSATRTTQKKKVKRSNAKAALDLTWEATEYAPRKRWWWYLALIVIALYASLIALLMGQWSIAAVIVAAAIAYLTIYSSKPKRYAYTLAGKRLEAKTLGVSGRRARTLQWDLADYRAFTDESITRSDGTKFLHFTLIPKARLGTAQDIYLTGDTETDIAIGTAFETVLPYDEDSEYRNRVTRLERLMGWLRLR